jgi:hypothetical protein
MRQHDERTAERLITSGLAALRMSEEELGATDKSDPRKQVLAWWVRGQTNVQNSWLSRRLQMGHPSSVTHARRTVASTEEASMKRWKRTLVRIAKF